MVPIPGFKSIQQVEDNAAVLQKGPLDDGQMIQIAEIQKSLFQEGQ
jgi:aryl-alcohol dehydrogenase-like predicted oxidoreductase